MKSDIDLVRRAHRSIRMVSELHRMGYQRLRIMPYAHPNAWRLAVGPSDNFSLRNGAFIPNDAWHNLAVHSSAGEGNNYFDWDDAKQDSARQLAEKFIYRFPQIAALGRGRDWAYAGWLAELVGFLEQGNAVPVVVAYSESKTPPPETMTALPLWTWPGTNEGVTFPLPPPVIFETGR